MATVDTTSPAQVLRSAADYLERHGWTSHIYYRYSDDADQPPAACALGALRIAVYGHPVLTLPNTGQASDLHHAADVLGAYLVRYLAFETFRQRGVDRVSVWNDQPDRTVSEVCTAMRRAADRYDRKPGGVA